MEERKSEDCLRRVLLEWLKTAGEKNWGMLRETMRDFKVGHVGVAEDVLICKYQYNNYLVFNIIIIINVMSVPEFAPIKYGYVIIIIGVISNISTAV